jgi:predicted enzyme related to lactoylglutathione lyase
VSEVAAGIVLGLRFLSFSLSWIVVLDRLLHRRRRMDGAEIRRHVMEQAFVWFHNSSGRPSETVSFYHQLLGWNEVESPPGMTLLGGDGGPLAAVGEAEGAEGWIPFAQVEDVDAATSKAQELGAAVLKEKTRGPAGEFSILRDPGGAVVALWQKA